MGKEIKVNEDAVREVQKVFYNASEEMSEIIKSLSRTIEIAENEGWSDDSYLNFHDEFLNLEKMINESISFMEDVLQPQLKHILTAIEGF